MEEDIQVSFVIRKKETPKGTRAKIVAKDLNGLEYELTYEDEFGVGRHFTITEIEN